MASAHYDTFTEARAHFRELLDTAERGRPVTVRRERSRAAVVDAERLRQLLARLDPSRAQVVAEAGGWRSFGPASATGPCPPAVDPPYHHGRCRPTSSTC